MLLNNSTRRNNAESMKKLKAKLMELQKQGFETITIAQVLIFIRLFSKMGSDKEVDYASKQFNKKK
jgi:hypothetical protein